ncbi:hypothetical protein TG4357_03346 [Thalassovita gelatinovora]|uniref:Phage protein n=1 Tax=Thalassovita gelatinovora TaxID=53501 RepID=A0A0P1G4Q3_THAGE|nr:hypothetical protein [Thalassovita gelatinovora]QIZ81586.1 hypothetical protein HFZ77_14420 [Thalassovita gelatinovora]CUH68022.1 hypothetical protein TG4357_03346 [Thalassovita gelatinovora]SEQ27686.1 hypothetical protein SAMN04488043_104217 [Thalassovita gelatinovora]
MTRHSRKLINREHLWNLAKIHEEFTAHDLAAAAHRSLEHVRQSIKDWVRWGYAKADGKRGNRDLYRVVKGKTGTPPATDPSGRVIANVTPHQSMWFVIRKSGVFSYRDVAMQANTQDVAVIEDQARDYCQMLANAGYLDVVRKADGKGRLALYRLVKNTGPLPPREKRIRAVWDDNARDYTYVSRGMK